MSNVTKDYKALAEVEMERLLTEAVEQARNNIEVALAVRGPLLTVQESLDRVRLLNEATLRLAGQKAEEIAKELVA